MKEKVINIVLALVTIFILVDMFLRVKGSWERVQTKLEILKDQRKIQESFAEVEALTKYIIFLEEKAGEEHEGKKYPYDLDSLFDNSS